MVKGRQRKLLVLGGADIQVTAIQKARELGYYVITCDNRPTNPGHSHGHEYHDVSTTDIAGVLRLAQKLRIDGISAYASDPAAVTAAYVSSIMGLPGDPYEAVRRVQDKVELRKLQHQLGIFAPEAHHVRTVQEILDHSQKWPGGGVMKPVDTSGSKGVFKIRSSMEPSFLESLLERSLSFSRSGKVILEEWIDKNSVQMTGDVLVVDGRIQFRCFGDVHFNTRVNGLVPRGVTIPGSIAEHKIDDAMADLQLMIDHLGLRQGVYNIDLFLDRDERPLMVDIGLRNGGNMLNTLYHLRTGVDLMELSLKMCMGEQIGRVTYQEDPTIYVGHCVIHALEEGELEKMEFSNELRSCIIYRSISVRPGDHVGRFEHSGHRLGLLLLKFPTKEKMLDMYANIYDHMQVRVHSKIDASRTDE
jgi:biotin carboxylase